MMSKTTNRIITVLFSAFIGGFFLLNLLLPDKDFSEKENRQLQTLPKFTLSSLFSGTLPRALNPIAATSLPAAMSGSKQRRARSWRRERSRTTVYFSAAASG